jgi:twitching motility protein PilT
VNEVNLVSSLLQAIVNIDGEALVMHAGDKPYVVSPSGQVELASRGLTLDAVTGIVAQLLPVEFQNALDEFGAVQYALPRQTEFPREQFTVVVARGGDDVWAEIRRKRVPDDDRIPDELFETAAPLARAVASAAMPAAKFAADDDVVVLDEAIEPDAIDDGLTLPAATHLWPPSAQRDVGGADGDGDDFIEVMLPHAESAISHAAEEPAPRGAPAIQKVPPAPPVAVAHTAPVPPALSVQAETAAASAQPVLAVPPAAPVKAVAPAQSVLAVPAVAPVKPVAPAQPVLAVPPAAPVKPVAPVQPAPLVPPAAPVKPAAPVPPALFVPAAAAPAQPVLAAPPAAPTKPVAPVQPVLAVPPAAPVKPVTPARPVPPVHPTAPVLPVAPERPAPLVQPAPEKPVAPARPPVWPPAVEAPKPAPPVWQVPPPPVTQPPATVLQMSRSIRAGAPPPAAADDTLSGLERLLRTAASRGASTLYLSSDARPSVRVDGELQSLDGEPLHTSSDVISLLLTLMPDRSHEALRTGATTEWICDIEDIGRVRCMSFSDHRGPGGVFRLMPVRTVSVDQLGLPREVQSLAIEPEGLVLVAGSRSSGKRTVMSALVDLINRSRRDHVITIEREVNIVHERGSSFISQREVRGNDDDVLAAARAALREDPDVLVLEHIRTGLLMNVALEAAASGHLVIGGFSAHNATESIDRIIDLYAPEYARQVQLALADNLRGVVAQVLLPRIGGGRVAAREVLLNTPAVAGVIAEGKTSQLPMAIEGGRRLGMVPLHDALVGYVQSGVVDVREAYRHVTDRPAFLALLKRQGIDTSVLERLA